jgi:hypothetical protein
MNFDPAKAGRNLLTDRMLKQLSDVSSSAGPRHSEAMYAVSFGNSRRSWPLPDQQHEVEQLSRTQTASPP